MALERCEVMIHKSMNKNCFQVTPQHEDKVSAAAAARGVSGPGYPQSILGGPPATLPPHTPMVPFGPRIMPGKNAQELSFGLSRYFSTTDPYFKVVTRNIFPPLFLKILCTLLLWLAELSAEST